MLNIDEVLKQFSNIADLNEKETLQCKDLAILAANHVEALCKKEIKDKKNNKIKEEYETTITLLAAALTNLWFVLKNCNKEPSGSFSGNGISISVNNDVKELRAKRFFEHIRASLSKSLIDGGFSFYATEKALVK